MPPELLRPRVFPTDDGGGVVDEGMMDNSDVHSDRKKTLLFELSLAYPIISYFLCIDESVFTCFQNGSSTPMVKLSLDKVLIDLPVEIPHLFGVFTSSTTLGLFQSPFVSSTWQFTSKFGPI